MPDSPIEDSGRVYSRAEASRLLPTLTEVLRSLLTELGQAADEKVAGRIRQRSGHNGGSAAASAMLRAGERVRRQMEFLQEHGILLRDVESGLVDFPALRDGEPVFLCWRLGEPEIGFWHRRDQGYVNRQPL